MSASLTESPRSDRRHGRDLQTLQPEGRRERRGHAGRGGLRLVGADVPRAGGHRECLRRSRRALPAPVRAGRRSTAGAGGGEHPRRRLRYYRGGFSFEGSAYYTSVKNDIFLTPFGEKSRPAAPSTDTSSTSIGPEVGAELAGRYLPGGHSLYLNYAYTRATFQTEAEPVQHPGGDRRGRTGAWRRGHQSIPNRERSPARETATARPRSSGQSRRPASARPVSGISARMPATSANSGFGAMRRTSPRRSMITS